MPVVNLPDPQPNISAETKALAESRSAMHVAAGRKLVAIEVSEIIQVSPDADLRNVVGVESTDPTMVRQLSGTAGTVCQVVTFGEIPAETFCPIDAIPQA